MDVSSRSAPVQSGEGFELEVGMCRLSEVFFHCFLPFSNFPWVYCFDGTWKRRTAQ